jgi:hypothetical protein
MYFSGNGEVFHRIQPFPLPGNTRIRKNLDGGSFSPSPFASRNDRFGYLFFAVDYRF